MSHLRKLHFSPSRCLFMLLSHTTTHSESTFVFWPLSLSLPLLFSLTLSIQFNWAVRTNWNRGSGMKRGENVIGKRSSMTMVMLKGNCRLHGQCSTDSSIGSEVPARQLIGNIVFHRWVCIVCFQIDCSSKMIVPNGTSHYTFNRMCVSYPTKSIDTHTHTRSRTQKVLYRLNICLNDPNAYKFIPFN